MKSFYKYLIFFILGIILCIMFKKKLVEGYKICGISEDQRDCYSNRNNSRSGIKVSATFERRESTIESAPQYTRDEPPPDLISSGNIKCTRSGVDYWQTDVHDPDGTPIINTNGWPGWNNYGFGSNSVDNTRDYGVCLDRCYIESI